MKYRIFDITKNEYVKAKYLFGKEQTLFTKEQALKEIESLNYVYEFLKKPKHEYRIERV